MLNNFFITIFLILVFWSFLNLKLKWKEDTPIWILILSGFLTIVMQSVVGTCIAMIIYSIWK